MADNYGGITGHLQASADVRRAAMKSQQKTTLADLDEREYQAAAAVNRDPSRRNMDDLEGIQRMKAKVKNWDMSGAPMEAD
jgi:hypothetical protein